MSKASSSSSNFNVKDVDRSYDNFSEFHKRGPSIAIWASLVALVAFLVWAKFSMLDEVSVGTGKVIPIRKEQVIQSLEGGILKELKVKEGDVVARGEKIAALDTTKANSNYEETASRIRSLQAASVRIRALLGIAPLSFPADVQSDPTLVSQETNYYQSRKRALNDSISNLTHSIDLAQKELSMTQPLVAKGAASQVEVLRLQRQINDMKTRISDIKNDFFTKNNEELVKNNAEMASLRQVAIGRLDSVDRAAVITSPVRGVVKDIFQSTIGAVIPPGGRIMEIVPVDDELLVEARLNPRDIAFIHPGLPATVKITAYDSAIYGSLPGYVDRVSPDTIQDEVKRDQYYYRVYVKTRSSVLKNKAGKTFPILPGMVSTVEIHTGNKSVLDYLMKPLNRAKEALRER